MKRVYCSAVQLVTSCWQITRWLRVVGTNSHADPKVCKSCCHKTTWAIDGFRWRHAYVEVWLLLRGSYLGGPPCVPNVLRSMGKTQPTHAFPLVTLPVRSPRDKFWPSIWSEKSTFRCCWLHPHATSPHRDTASRNSPTLFRTQCLCCLWTFWYVSAYIMDSHESWLHRVLRLMSHYCVIVSSI